MATARISAVDSSLQPASSSLHIPNTFLEALKAGWTVSSERGVLSRDGKERRGIITLSINGRAERLEFCYVATPARYTFHAPRMIR